MGKPALERASEPQHIWNVSCRKPGSQLYLCFLDEVGAYYTDRIAVEATQVRSLDFALILMAQDQERIEGQTSATSTATLMQNTGTKFAGRVVSDDKTARTLKNAAGEEARARMNSLQRQDGVFGDCIRTDV